MGFYSLLPYVFVAGLMVAALVRKRASPLLAPLVLMVLLNEFGLKHVIMQPRPDGSCDDSFGMPSGHSMVSIGTFVWYASKGAMHIARTGYHHRFGISLAMHGGLWLPVPYSRIYLRYHTVEQVLVGGLIGLLCGCLLWWHSQRRLAKEKKLEDRKHHATFSDA